MLSNPDKIRYNITDVTARKYTYRTRRILTMAIKETV